MKKFLIFAFAALCLSSVQGIATPCENAEVYAEDVLSRGTSRLYCGDECLTLYSNGKFTITKGDYMRLEGTYQLSDGWVILKFNNGNEVSCKATISSGSVQNVSYNGNVYRKR